MTRSSSRFVTLLRSVSFAWIAPAGLVLLAPVASMVAGCSMPVEETESVERSSPALNPALVGQSGQILIAGGSVEVDYTGQPKYLAIKTIFTSATAGVHPVTVEPLDDHGDAALWITDGAFTNLAISRPSGSRSAGLDFEFPHGSGTMLVIRDEAFQPSRFRVSLSTPANPDNPDPDEGDSVGGEAPDDIAGKRCDGVVGIQSLSQMYDYKGDPVFATQPKKGNVSVSASIVSESQIRVTTNATYAPGRDLHRVASSSFVSSPTQMEWLIPTSRNAAGSIVGSGSLGSAKVNVVVGETQLQLSFSGKISQPWNGNTETLTVSADGKVPLSACVSTTPDAGTCCKTSSSAGCDTNSVEQCVCAADAYCCNTAWDHICVAQVESLSCGTCP